MAVGIEIYIVLALLHNGCTVHSERDLAVMIASVFLIVFSFFDIVLLVEGILLAGRALVELTQWRWYNFIIILSYCCSSIAADAYFVG